MPKSHDNKRAGHPNAHNSGRGYCMSITNFKKGKVLPTWFEGQMPEDDSRTYQHPDTMHWPPRKFPVKGAPIRVPRTIIISVFPFWTTATSDYYDFQFNRAPILGNLLTEPSVLGNYYYISQWDECQSNSYAQYPGGSPPSYVNGITNNDGARKGGRFNQVVASVQNPYTQYLKTFYQNVVPPLQDWINSLKPKGEWNLIVPKWVKYPFPNLPNDYLQLEGVTYFGNDWHKPMDPYESTYPIQWSPGFPNPWGMLNGEPPDRTFNGEKVPWLTAPFPGLGTDVLHLYIGHPNISYGGGTSCDSYQAWPLSPEAGYIGDTQWYSYVPSQGAVTTNFQPYFWGRRPLWRDLGYNYGYTGGVSGVYDLYSSIVSGAIDNYSENFWKYRNITTQAYTFAKGGWIFPWNPYAIQKDMSPGRRSILFYFGWDSIYQLFNSIGSGELIPGYDPPCGQDYTVVDESAESGGLKVGYTQNIFPSTCSIQRAISVFFPKLTPRIEAYYNGIEPGAADFWNLATSSPIPGFTFKGEAEILPSMGWFQNIISEYYGIK